MSKKTRPQPITVSSKSRNKKNRVAPQAPGSNPARDVGGDVAVTGEGKLIPIDYFKQYA